MPFPIQHLPVIQNWDCHMCGHCCVGLTVPVSEEERRRIEGQGWSEQPDFQGKELFVQYGGWGRPKYRLNHREEDRCIFLSAQGLCRIHEKFGAAAKPVACRLFPYALVPAGDHWRVSLRFSCPSVAQNKGRPLSIQGDDVRELAAILEQSEEVNALTQKPPPPLQGRQRLGWEDLQHFVDALLRLIEDRSDSLARRMLKCLALVRACRSANFDQVTGPRLREFLEPLHDTVDAQVARDLATLPPPSWMGRLLFRTTLSFYLRKDSGPRRGVSKRGRFAMIGSTWRFVRGTGPIPPMQVGLPERTFEELETPAGPPQPEVEEALERFYRVKIESLQFCGPTCFDLAFWDGFEGLALTLPILYWLSRGYRELGAFEAVCKSLFIVDDHFGFDPFLGSLRQRLAVSLLAMLQELDRLIAWYAR